MSYLSTPEETLFSFFFSWVGRRKARALDTWAEEGAKPDEDEGLEAVNRPRLVNRVAVEPLRYCRLHYLRTLTLAT